MEHRHQTGDDRGARVHMSKHVKQTAEHSYSPQLPDPTENECILLILVEKKTTINKKKIQLQTLLY